jgi:hypothetical protein
MQLIVNIRVKGSRTNCNCSTVVLRAMIVSCRLTGAVHHVFHLHRETSRQSEPSRLCSRRTACLQLRSLDPATSGKHTHVLFKCWLRV